jgi:hypothetical protein
VTDLATGSLRIVDGFRLDKPRRDALMPGGVLRDLAGRTRQLPRYFYEVESWQAALEFELAPHFHLWEFIQTDVREAVPIRFFPRYVPCAVTLTASLLEQFRDAVGEPVRISANGGYRSPRHQLTAHASTHCWGSAVNIYRVGADYLDTRDRIERYAEIAREVLPAGWIRPVGEQSGFADDHLHIDFGYLIAVPHDAPGDPFNPKLEGDPL